MYIYFNKRIDIKKTKYKDCLKNNNISRKEKIKFVERNGTYYY